MNVKVGKSALGKYLGEATVIYHCYRDCPVYINFHCCTVLHAILVKLMAKGSQFLSCKELQVNCNLLPIEANLRYILCTICTQSLNAFDGLLPQDVTWLLLPQSTIIFQLCSSLQCKQFSTTSSCFSLIPVSIPNYKCCCLLCAQQNSILRRYIMFQCKDVQSYQL